MEVMTAAGSASGGSGRLGPVRPGPQGRLSRVRRFAPLVALPVAPLQGAWLTRTVPRFPDADGRSGTVGTGPRPLRLVVLGDSVAAGYAVPHHRTTVAGALAARLAQAYAATVTWQVVATTGATAGSAMEEVGAPEGRAALADADVVFVSIGVNDAKNLHSAGRFRRELGALLDAVLAAAPRAELTVLGIPPLEQLPAVPRPLADALGWRGRRLDRVGAQEVARRPRVHRLWPADVLVHEMFAADGFHPSEHLHAMFADAALSTLATASALAPSAVPKVGTVADRPAEPAGEPAGERALDARAEGAGGPSGEFRAGPPEVRSTGPAGEPRVRPPGEPTVSPSGARPASVD
jgi:lysophospholipase L1-like esterase